MDTQESLATVDEQNHGHRWVVGIDGSECSRHAALWAAKQAPGRATEVQLATTWSIPVSSSMAPMSLATTSASFDALEQSAHANVDELASNIEPLLDVPVTRSVGHGGAASFLLGAAEGSELLVVGSRGRGGFARLVLGSTSTQCATHSSVPVAVIPSTAPIAPVVSIIVAFDGSDNSIAALRWASGFAAPGSTINCVSVWDTTPIAVGSDQFFFPEASDLAKERFEHLVTETIKPIKRDDVEVRHTFVTGQPRAVMSKLAADGDLLVMGARGHGAIGAVVLGSVSTWLLHHITQPMVVVPHQPGGDTDPDRAHADEQD